MAWRVLRHWNPMLRLPRKMSFAIVNTWRCLFMLWNFMGMATSCLLETLTLFTVVPLPWERMHEMAVVMIYHSNWFSSGEEERRVIAGGVST